MSNPYKAPADLEHRLRQDMVDAVTLLFVVYENSGYHSFKSIARVCKLHPNTLRNLWGGVTRYPRFQTLQKLAHGVDMRVVIDVDGVYVRSLSKRTANA